MKKHISPASGKRINEIDALLNIQINKRDDHEDMYSFSD